MITADKRQVAFERLNQWRKTKGRIRLTNDAPKIDPTNLAVVALRMAAEHGRHDLRESYALLAEWIERTTGDSKP